jgi:hypothetical protein
VTRMVAPGNETIELSQPIRCAEFRVCPKFNSAHVCDEWIYSRARWRE